MKLIPLLLLLCGCVSPNLAKVVKELAKDPATVSIRVQTVYGNATLDRSNPCGCTNAVPVVK